MYIKLCKSLNVPFLDKKAMTFTILLSHLLLQASVDIL